MYRKTDDQIHLFEILMEDNFKLDLENRWVKRAKAVPWELAEQKYSHMFKKNGRPAKQIRMALGSLLIKEFLQCSDEEVVQSILEQPYLQYFVGLKKFTTEAPFDPSLMVWFRKRLSTKLIKEINEAMCKAEAMPKEVTEPEDDEGHGGTLIIDASCAPADIKYPTDTGLLAEAIEKTDAMIDTMQEPLVGKQPRPRTYRKKSRKLYAGFVKQRKPSAKTIRRCRGKQLNYLKRNLNAVRKMRDSGGSLSGRQERMFDTIQTLYEQQHQMHGSNTTRVDDRIVSLSQPHVRPIVRGKAGTPVEFGAKVNVSVVNGYTFISEISYDAFYEGDYLENAIIDYYTCFGILPTRILCDNAFINRDNRELCKDLKIGLSCKPLGRPPKEPAAVKTPKCTESRSEVEGRFGTLKTRYGWDRVMARLDNTGMSVISVAVLAMNLAKIAKLKVASLRFFLLNFLFSDCLCDCL